MAANVFGGFCGVVLFIMVICYFRDRRTKCFSFDRMQTRGTDLEESASEFSVIGNGGNKYDFHPVNVALNQRMSDEESTSEDEEMHVVDHREQAQQGGESSHDLEQEEESDEYGSDEDHERSKKQHEMLGIDE